ncbi:ABC transporter [Arthrobacter crystallopoietes BAB-32]|uniref:ABC transporter n=1 Tax=Arthrobacter crystallopoietes BAB-32 TaxID=1246476 RepID=N1V0I3_9MICC|nr:ABC transporter [Arthrobacter crystallopoietes BAB-32]
MVKAIAGVQPPDSGTIFGEAYEANDVAMVFQELSVVPEMSVRDNLMLAARGRRALIVRPKALQQSIEAALDSAGLSGMNLDLPVEVLSLAQRQLLEIARGLIADARVLILDEPTATLSDVEIAKVHHVVRRLTSEGRAIVYITHRLGEVFELADSMTIMRAGRVVAGGRVRDFDMSTMVAHMLGADHVPADKTVALQEVGQPRELVVQGLNSRNRFADVALRARAGEVVALFGQIGSGADEVVRALAGVTGIDSGSVELDGKVVKVHDRATAQQSGIAYISADRVHEGVFLSASVATNVSSGALGKISRLGVIRSSQEQRLAAQTMSKVAFDTRRIAEPVSSFSGGNQQKVTVGRALATEPHVLILNEPTRGVDIGARSEIYRSLRELAAHNVVILIYTSDVVEVRELADHVVTLYRGRVVGRHRVDEVSNAVITTEILGGAA